MGREATTLSFSGVDGAGKSTQIAALCDHLRREGLRVRVIAFWDEVAALTGMREGAGHKIFKGEKGVGSPQAPVNRRDKNVRSWPMSCVRLGLYFLDAIQARTAVRRARESGVDLVIFDRYIYDELANLNLKNGVMRAYARMLMKVAPRLGVSFVLDADPAEARARKPEYPLEFIRINRQAYLDLSALIGGITVIRPTEIAEAHREILRHALAALATKNSTRKTMAA